MRILLVEDSAPVRRSLRDLIEIAGGHTIVGEASNGQEAIDRTAELEPDLVLMDVNMPIMNGVDATRVIKERHPDVKILALTALGDMAHVSSMVKVGASGYLLKGGSSEELLESIKAVARGEGALNKDIGLDMIKGMVDLEAQLRQAQKMESVGQLVGGVAHDFNNVISVIANYTEFIRAELDPDDDKHKDLAEIADAAQRASQLVAQLMTFSRKEDAEPQLLDLNEVVSAAAKLWSRALGEDIEVKTELAQTLPAVRIDPTHIDQILMNLMVNARDAMPTGGTLTISTFNEVDLADRHAGVAGHVSLWVTDTGTGMEEAVADRIFDPFFSTKPRDSGTGLGLATVHGIVKQALGWIELETAPGQGSSFRIYLPVAEEPAGQVISLEDPHPGAAVPDRGIRVLVVEDDEAVSRVVQRILARGGYEVSCAHSAPDALHLIDGQPFELLLTDVVLPGSSGPELARTLAARGSTMPIAFMSGYPDQVLHRHDLPEGSPMLEKPFTARDLLEVVSTSLSGLPR